MGGGVSAPTLVYKVEPEYSEEARKARYQGIVLLYIEVDVNGRAQNMRVISSLGLGLDEKAMDAVKKWKFRPGMKDGKPVTSCRDHRSDLPPVVIPPSTQEQLRSSNLFNCSRVC